MRTSGRSPTATGRISFFAHLGATSPRGGCLLEMDFAAEEVHYAYDLRMNWPATCAVVIPCRDEETGIAWLVREVRQYLPLVVVVDDNSGDETAARAVEAGAQVIRRSKNPGKGAAVKAGVATALAQNCAWAMTLDGDGQHRPEDIPALLRRAEETGVSLVVGNRMHQAKAIPWVRRGVNRWMSRRISKVAGRLLPDSQCGFRLFNLKAWAALRLETDHFEIESEMLLAFVRAGDQVEFVPIQVIGKGRRSHICPVKDTWRWLRWWIRVRLGRNNLIPPQMDTDKDR